MKSIFQIVALIIGLVHPISAQPGHLDSTFNLNGRVTTDFLPHWAIAKAGGLQSDGKIIAAGTLQSGNDAHIGVARYTTSGVLDTTFGVDGKVIIENILYYTRALSIQPDDKILIGGITPYDTNAHIALLRLHPDGGPDSTFGINGVTILALEGRGNNGTSIAMQQDGKIVMAGYISSPSAKALVCRFTPDGTPDSSFGTFGRIVTDIPFYANGANAIAIQGDGKIVTGGYVGHFAFDGSIPIFDFSLIRYHENGRLDSTFNEDGIVKTSISQWVDQLYGLAIQPDGKIIAAGHTNSGDPNHTNFDFVVARYNVDGSLDMDFGTDGLAITPFGTDEDGANAVAIQSDGKIVAVGHTTNWLEGDFAIVRLHPDGSLDSTWGNNGKVTTDFNSSKDYGNSVVLQPDGKIIAIGGPNFALARYLPELFMGVLDFSTVHDILLYPNPIQENIVLEYTLVKDEIVTIEIVDISGRSIQLLANRVSKLKGTYNESYQLSKDILPGIYFVCISNQYGSISIKTIKE